MPRRKSARSGDRELGRVGRRLLNRPEKEQGSVERAFQERYSGWHDLEAGVSLTCPEAARRAMAGALCAWGEGSE